LSFIQEIAGALRHFDTLQQMSVREAALIMGAGEEKASLFHDRPVVRPTGKLN
jgi:hypothetical protein